MHALSTQRKANSGNDVNDFPIEGTMGKNWGSASSSPLFSIFRAEWHVNDYHFMGHSESDVLKWIEETC